MHKETQTSASTSINLQDLDKLQHYLDARFAQLNTSAWNSNFGAVTLES